MSTASGEQGDSAWRVIPHSNAHSELHALSLVCYIALRSSK